MRALRFAPAAASLIALTTLGASSLAGAAAPMSEVVGYGQASARSAADNYSLNSAQLPIEVKGQRIELEYVSKAELEAVLADYQQLHAQALDQLTATDTSIDIDVTPASCQVSLNESLFNPLSAKIPDGAVEGDHQFGNLTHLTVLISEGDGLANYHDEMRQWVDQCANMSMSTTLELFGTPFTAETLVQTTAVPFDIGAKQQAAWQYSITTAVSDPQDESTESSLATIVVATASVDHYNVVATVTIDPDSGFGSDDEVADPYLALDAVEAALARIEGVAFPNDRG